MRSEKDFFENLCLHHVGSFQIPLLERRESIDETINKLRIEDSYRSNTNLFDRTTHLYWTSEECLRPLRESLIRNCAFTHVEIQHKSSSIGLPYQIYAKHKNGEDLYFDGLSYRIRKTINNEKFGLSALPELAGYPLRADNIVRDLEKSLREVIPELPEFSYSMYIFYTCYVENWNNMGIARTGEAQLYLKVNDPKIFTITGLVHTKIGKDFNLFIGDENVILEMNSHHIFYATEYERFSKYIDSLRNKIGIASGCVSDSMNDITKSFIKLNKKYASWNNAKSQIREMYRIKKNIFKYKILSETVSKIVEERWASRNSPKQIWFDSEVDHEWMQSYWCSNFFEGTLKNDAIIDLQELPIKPLFSYAVEDLVEKVNLLNNELNDIVSEMRDLLAAIQTEFSMYAVWLAFGAVLVSVIVGLMSLGAA